MPNYLSYCNQYNLHEQWLGNNSRIPELACWLHYIARDEALPLSFCILVFFSFSFLVTWP